MARTRRSFDGKFKSKVALEAIRSLKTISEIATQFKVHPNQVTLWKKQLLEGAVDVFESSGSSAKKKQDTNPRQLTMWERRILSTSMALSSNILIRAKRRTH